MIKIRKSIRSLYDINLVEGEGVGTAYEYYAKFRKLNKFINSIEKPERILIAGLPEKYGLSMDFFLLGQILGAETVVIDERSGVLERARDSLSILTSRKLVISPEVQFLKVDNITEFNNENLIESKFDLALSSEVLQRLNGSRGAYISSLNKIARNFAIFAPNRGNESHANLSGLNSVHLKELLNYCQDGPLKAHIYDCGYIDMPPFPPGMSRSQEKRDKATKSQLEAFLMKGLEIYNFFEDIFPKIAKEKMAHIVYIMAKKQ